MSDNGKWRLRAEKAEADNERLRATLREMRGYVNTQVALAKIDYALERSNP